MLRRRVAVYNLFNAGIYLKLTRLQQTRDPHAYPDARPPQSPYNNPYRSPVASSFPHHSPLQRPASHGHIAANMEAVSHSPASPRNYHAMNHGAVQPPPQHYERRPSVKEDVSTTVSIAT